MSGKGGWTRAFKAVGFVTALPISVIFAGAIGLAVDRRFETGWWFTILFGLLGFTAGILHLTRGLRQLSDDDASDHPS